jgi:DNA-binding transcriptional MerR regulator
VAESFAFDDGKDAGALRTIGEVAAGFGIRQHVLRYWEQQFPMLRPLKRSGGRRYYRPEDVELLKRIRDLLYRQGMTIRGVQQVLRAERRGGRGQAAGEGPPANAAVAGDPLVQELYALRDELVALRRLIARGS